MLSLIVSPRMAGLVFGPDEPYYTDRFYPELAAALSDLIGSEVPILHTTLDGAPTQGWILADQTEFLQRYRGVQDSHAQQRCRGEGRTGRRRPAQGGPRRRLSRAGARGGGAGQGWRGKTRRHKR